MPEKGSGARERRFLRCQSGLFLQRLEGGHGLTEAVGAERLDVVAAIEG